MPPAKDRLKELQEKKLLAEIAKLKAEKRKVDIEAENLERYAEEEEASSDRALVYTFDKVFTEQSVRACIEDLSVWSRRDPGKPITIVFNSPGGGVFAGMALFDFIRQLRDAGHHVTTVALGWAASMAGILLQAGDTRVIGKHAWLMIHEVSTLAAGSASDIEDEAKLMRRMQDQILTIFAERSTMSKAQIGRRWKRRDWWLTSEQALELGFADEIK